VSQTRSYVICTTPRCGSWLLAEALTATGVAGRPEEYLRPDWYARFKACGELTYQHRLHRDDPWPDGTQQARSEDPPRQDSADYDGFLSVVCDLGTTSNGVFGLKVHRGQFATAVSRMRACRGDSDADEPSLLNSWLSDVRFVYLWRRDELRRAISHHRAVVSDVWWVTDETADRGELPAPNRADLIEVDRLIHKVREQNRQWRAMFERSGVQPLELTYEQLTADLPGSVAAVLRHVGIMEQPHEPAPRLARQADGWTDATVHAYLTWRRGRLDERPDISVGALS
jgi:LPS sulfotransferase NodH